MGAFRWNWSTPFIMSESNPRTLYLGANHLFKTHAIAATPGASSAPT